MTVPEQNTLPVEPAVNPAVTPGVADPQKDQNSADAQAQADEATKAEQVELQARAQRLDDVLANTFTPPPEQPPVESTPSESAPQLEDDSFDLDDGSGDDDDGEERIRGRSRKGRGRGRGRTRGPASEDAPFAPVDMTKIDFSDPEEVKKAMVGIGAQMAHGFNSMDSSLRDGFQNERRHNQTQERRNAVKIEWNQVLTHLEQITKEYPEKMVTAARRNAERMVGNMKVVGGPTRYAAATLMALKMEVINANKQQSALRAGINAETNTRNALLGTQPGTAPGGGITEPPLSKQGEEIKRLHAARGESLDSQIIGT